MTDERRPDWIACPDAEACKRCPCAGDDDACFPGERLRAELARLKAALERVERVYERTMPGPRDALRDQVLEITSAALRPVEREGEG